MADKPNQFKPINFMRLKWFYFILSGMVIIPGSYSLIRYGLKPSIDFTGGALIELQPPAGHQFTPNQIEQSVPSGMTIASVQPTTNNTVIIRSSPITKDQNQEFQYNLASASGLLTASAAAQLQTGQTSPINELRFETVGPTLGKELINKTIIAIFLAALTITLYVAFRFNELKYGISAILAMLHDTLVIVGTFSLLGHFYGVEVDTLFVTAVLTILSFSVHDTIVVYDRIRESLKYHPSSDFIGLVNKAVTETLSRSINNSMTIIFMLLALWLMGGESTKWFVFALLVGTISGTYSSTFTAAPILVVWENVSHYLKTRRRR